jgi:hypothetical protein
MNYLVVRPHHGQFCTLTVVPEGTDIIGNFESWALSKGSQILYVNNRMDKDLKPYYMSGSYQAGAMYAYSYDEMIAIIKSRLGPSDYERYEMAVAQSHALQPKQIQYNPLAAVWIEGIATTLIHGVLLSIKFVVLMCIVPFVIMFLNKK